MAGVELGAGDGPGAVAAGTLGEQVEEAGVFEVPEGEGGFLADLDVGEVEVPDLFGGLALGEEEEVGLDAGAGGGEDARGKADHAPEVAVVQELALGLAEGGLVGAEEDALVQDDAAAAGGLERLKDVLEEQHLGGAGTVVEVGLGFLAFLAAEGRVGEDDVEERGGADEEVAVGLGAGEGVAVPEVRLVDAVEDEVGEGDGVDDVVVLAAVEGSALEGVDLVGGGVEAKAGAQVLEGLGEEAAGAAAGVVDGLADLGIDGIGVEGVDAVEDAEEVGLGIDARALDAGAALMLSTWGSSGAVSDGLCLLRRCASLSGSPSR